jgi:hypothetical protein
MGVNKVEITYMVSGEESLSSIIIVLVDVATVVTTTTEVVQVWHGAAVLAQVSCEIVFSVHLYINIYYNSRANI